MEQLKTKERKINKNLFFIVIGLIITVIGSSVLIYNHFSNQKLEKLEEESIEAFFEEPITEDEENQPEETPKVEQEVKIDYKAILEIPKINLKKGIVDENSSHNNVNKNIYVVKETIFPDGQNISHIILAAHSGNSYVSYFRNLNKLSLDDEVYFYYGNIKYIYKISNRYEIQKTGTAKLKQTNISDITLITCISGTNKQVVYVATLIDTKNY